MSSIKLVIPRVELESSIKDLIRTPEQSHYAQWADNKLTGSSEKIITSFKPMSLTPNHITQPGLVLYYAEQQSLTNNDIKLPGYAYLGLYDDGRILAHASDHDGQPLTIDDIFLPGPGMHHLTLQQGLTTKAREKADLRWSREAGALGIDTLSRLKNARIALVGLGRNGSLMANSLAKLGIKNLFLIDPDHLEPHNIAAMDIVSSAQLGDMKVTAIQKSLAPITQHNQHIQAIPFSVTQMAAIRYLADADMIISCVDDDGARLCTGIIASAYQRPLLDIGSGIFGHGEQRQMGADIRLILPGESRCISCLGGFSRMTEIDHLTRNEKAEKTDWAQQRAGSLRSLNQLAVHLGLRLLEDLFGELIQTSSWLRLSYQNGLPEITALTPRNESKCRLCQTAGIGDSVLSKMPLLIRQLVLEDQAKTQII